MLLRVAACALSLSAATAACAHPGATRGPGPAAGAFALAMDLQTQGDAETILQRIESAARLACVTSARDGEALRRRDDCVADTVDQAVRRLGDPRLERLRRHASEARP